MPNTLPGREGYVPFHGYRTWYRIFGERDEAGKYPLLVLHRGPRRWQGTETPSPARTADGCAIEGCSNRSHISLYP